MPKEADTNYKVGSLDSSRYSGPDGVKAYLQEIGEYPILTADQEVELSKRVIAGQQALGALVAFNTIDFVLGRQSAPSLEAKALILDGKDAAKTFAQHNLRLVVSIAKRYVGNGLPLLDLIQEGNLGLMRGVQKFDPDKGFKFSTYATWWIRQAVTRAICDTGGTVRIPVYVHEDIRRFTAVKAELLRTGISETDAEIAAQRVLGISDSSFETIKMAMSVKNPISIDQTVGEDDDTPLHELLVAPQSDGESELQSSMLRDELEKFLSRLNERERQVLRLRFGLDGADFRTLEDVGQAFGVTRERIRQIEAKALGKLRHPAAGSIALKEFFGLD